MGVVSGCHENFGDSVVVKTVVSNELVIYVGFSCGLLLIVEIITDPFGRH